MTVIKPILHHVNIKTRRLADMIEWYSTVTGAHVVFQNEGAAWLTNDAANHRLAFLAPPHLQDDDRKRRRAGMHHCAFEYASFDNLIVSYERLRALGITPLACLDHGMTISMYYADPDGNYVELQSDIFGDWAQSSRWMSSDLVNEEVTIGRFFNPQAVADAHRGGASLAEIRNGIKSGPLAAGALTDLGIDV